MSWGKRILRAFIYSFVIASTGFIILFMAPLLLGGPGSHQAPLLAFVAMPVIAVVSMLLVLISPRSTLLLWVLVVLGCSKFAYDTYQKSQQAFDAYQAEFHLSNAERQLLHIPPFDLTLAVKPGRFPEVYQESLIRELNRRQWFKQVGKPGEISSPDLIATITGNYYGDKVGHSFTLAWSGKPETRQKVNAWRWVTNRSDTATRTLYDQRLTVEVVKAVQALQQIHYATSAGNYANAGVRPIPPATLHQQ